MKVREPAGYAAFISYSHAADGQLAPDGGVSPDGKNLVSSSGDQTVQLWPITVDACIRHACTLAKRNLNKDEWGRIRRSSHRHASARLLARLTFHSA